MSTDFQVNRDDFRDCRFGPAATPQAQQHGDVVLAIDRFAFTSNNVTYAVAGDMLDYWGFFPGQDRWGRIPTMGFGDVVASKHPDVAEGARFFGFFPMSNHLKIHTEGGGGGMVDTAPHRAKQAATYRSYVSVDTDVLYEPAREDQLLLLRGLFLTSFLIDDFLADNDFFGASTTVVTSASSKTSISLAHQLHARAHGSVVGLTSAGNRAFVESLGTYDRVLDYAELESLDGAERAVLVDMAGNADVTYRVHSHFAGTLAHSSFVGMTHWQEAERGEGGPCCPVPSRSSSSLPARSRSAPRTGATPSYRPGSPPTGAASSTRAMPGFASSAALARQRSSASTATSSKAATPPATATSSP